MPGEQHLQTDLRIGGAVSARKFNAAMREVEILSRLRAGPGIRITRNRSGMSIQATRQEGRGGGGAVAPLVETVFVLGASDFADYVTCKRIGDDDTPTGDAFAVAKPWFFRRTPFDGQLRKGIRYTFLSNTRRLASKGTGTDAAEQTEILVPSYYSGFEADSSAWRDRIDIYQVKNSGVTVDGHELRWQEAPGQRAWAVEN